MSAGKDNTVLGNPHRSDASGTSYRSQISSVFHHPTHQDLYIALADRWLPQLSEADSDQTEAFRRQFESREAGRNDTTMTLPEADTSIADCVWLPIHFDGDMPIIDWHYEWHIEDAVTKTSQLHASGCALWSNGSRRWPAITTPGSPREGPS